MQEGVINRPPFGETLPKKHHSNIALKDVMFNKLEVSLRIYAEFLKAFIFLKKLFLFLILIFLYL